MLASTIQFTTNPPTPTPHHPHKAAEHGSGNQGALPQNPDSMPPHTRTQPRTPGAPTTTDHHDHKAAAAHHSGRVSYTKHTRQPTTPHNSARQHSHPAFRESKHPGRPRPINGPDKIKRPGSHPHHQSLERR